MGLLSSAALRPLRRRDFALVWSSAFVSNIGVWMQTVAVGILVTELTGQAGWTGIVAAAAFLPIGVLSPVGGAMADRVDRRKWLLATNVGETFFAVLLTVIVATGNASAVGVTLVMLGSGCMTALGLPAFQALLPDLVDREDLLAASSLGLASYNLGRVVGPALTGVVLALGSPTWAFAINAVSYLAIIAALLVVRVESRPPPTDDGGLWARIVIGARAARADPGCRAAIVAIGITALLLSPFIALIPAVAIVLLGGDDTGTSVLVTAQGAGAVLGALALAALARRFGRRQVLVRNLAVLPVLLVLYGLAPNLVVATAALFLVGGAYVGVLSGLGTVVQLRAPNAVRARVLSLYMVALGVIYPLAAIAQGFLGDQVGLRAVTVGTAVLYLVIVVGVRLARPGLVEVFDDRPHDELATDSR